MDFQKQLLVQVGDACWGHWDRVGKGRGGRGPASHHFRVAALILQGGSTSLRLPGGVGWGRRRTKWFGFRPPVLTRLIGHASIYTSNSPANRACMLPFLAHLPMRVYLKASLSHLYCKVQCRYRIPRVQQPVDLGVLHMRVGRVPEPRSMFQAYQASILYPSWRPTCENPAIVCSQLHILPSDLLNVIEV